MDVKRYEGTSPLRDISQHILDILKFDVLPDCSGSNWIHLEDIRQNEQLGSQVYISETAIAWARLRKAAANAMENPNLRVLRYKNCILFIFFPIMLPQILPFFKKPLHKTFTLKFHVTCKLSCGSFADPI